MRKAVGPLYHILSCRAWGLRTSYVSGVALTVTENQPKIQLL
jgi:hypothetical protein